MNGAKVSRATQVGIYLGKHWRLFLNEHGWKVLIFGAVISVLVSVVLGSGMFVYTMETFSGCFTLISACIWIGIFNSIQTICKERAIIKREHRAGLHITSYVASHLIFQAGICLLQAALLLGISSIFLTYPAVSPLFGSVLLEYFVTYFLATYAADVLGLAISAIVKTPTTAMTVMPFVLIIQLILSGMLFSLEGPLAIFGNLTISKWGLNATAISADYNNLENTQKIQLAYTLKEMVRQQSLPIPDEQVDQMVEENYTVAVNEDYVHDAGKLAGNWGMILLHTAVYAAVAVVALEFVDKDKR